MINTDINKYIIFISLTIFLIIVVVLNNSQEKFQNEYVSELLTSVKAKGKKGIHLGNPLANDDEILVKYIENTLEDKKCVFEEREEENKTKCLLSDDDNIICKEYNDLKPYEKDTYIEIKRIKQLIKLHGLKNILDRINTLDS